jgi:RimJ/RimL family protein N-acetyltransferase
MPPDLTSRAMLNNPQLVFSEIDYVCEVEAVAAFLARHTWPFHARSTLTLEEALRIKLGPPEQVRSYWIRENLTVVGTVRILDVEDADSGSVLFDLRIADEHRGRGIGRATVAWIVDMLFAEYPSLHRVEAATRIDNYAMRRALESNKFVLEGQLRQTWRSEDGIRHDTALYGRLRTDNERRASTA